MNNGGFGGAGTNPGPGNYQGGNTYGGTGNQAYGYDGSNGSGSVGNQFQANIFGGARQMALNGPHTFRILFANGQHKGRRLRFLILLMLLLVAIAFGFTHDWIISKARMAIPRAAGGIRSHLPVMGFVGIFASIATCLSVKHLTVQRVRQARSRPRCPLHALTKPPLPFKCRPSGYEIPTRGEGYL